MHSSLNKGILDAWLNPDGTVAWDKLYAALQINDDQEFAQLLLYLYRLDWQVAHIINERLMSIATGKLFNPDQLEAIPPTTNPLAWLNADKQCDKCPGSELLSYGTFTYPRCACVGRLEKYRECQKYRDNLNIETTQEELNNHSNDLKLEIERFTNALKDIQ